MSFNIYPRSYEDQLEYKEWLSELIALTEQELPTPKPKNKSKKIGKKHITSHSSRPQKAASAEFSVTHGHLFSLGRKGQFNGGYMNDPLKRKISTPDDIHLIATAFQQSRGNIGDVRAESA